LEVNTSTVKEARNIPHKIKRNKVKWVGHILSRNWFSKHVIEENIEGKSKRRIISKQLLHDLKEKR
jgi:hypothetical protein